MKAATDNSRIAKENDNDQGVSEEKAEARKEQTK